MRELAFVKPILAGEPVEVAERDLVEGEALEREEVTAGGVAEGVWALADDALRVLSEQFVAEVEPAMADERAQPGRMDAEQKRGAICLTGPRGLAVPERNREGMASDPGGVPGRRSRGRINRHDGVFHGHDGG